MGVAQARLRVSGPGDEGDQVKKLTLRRPDTCAGCSAALPAGTVAVWDAASRTVSCLSCYTVAPGTGPHEGVMPTQADEPAESVLATTAGAAPGGLAGGSARAEYQRRAQRRETAIRSRHPRLGGLILALSNEPASTRVWAQGARGEQAVGAKLDELAGEHLIALHDRRLIRSAGRASKANIDHLAVTAAGVWVIDAKTHQGQLEVRRSGGLLTPRVERLFIGGRDKTGLLETLAKQVTAVKQVLADADAPVPVRGVLCFVGTELPWFGSSSIGGVPLVGRRGLGKLMRQPGELTSDDRQLIASWLDRRFVPAT